MSQGYVYGKREYEDTWKHSQKCFNKPLIPWRFTYQVFTLAHLFNHILGCGQLSRKLNKQRAKKIDLCKNIRMGVNKNVIYIIFVMTSIIKQLIINSNWYRSNFFYKNVR